MKAAPNLSKVVFIRNGSIREHPRRACKGNPEPASLGVRLLEGGEGFHAAGHDGSARRIVYARRPTFPTHSRLTAQ